MDSTWFGRGSLDIRIGSRSDLTQNADSELTFFETRIRIPNPTGDNLFASCSMKKMLKFLKLQF